jgi:hypothetical protein
MKKLKPAFLLCGISFLFCSCLINKQVISLNGPAFYNNDISYQPKPISADTVHHATYISASLINGQGANTNDALTAGELNLGMAYTLKHFNIAYGAFGAAGSFNNQTIPQGQPYYFSNKFAGITGGRASFNYYITSGRVDIRILGIEAAYSHEFGDYANYRKDVAGVPGFYTNTLTNLFTVGGSSEVTWYARDPSLQFGFRLFLGATNGSYPNYNFYNNQREYGSFAYFMQIKKYFMVAEFNSGGGHFNLGYRF